MRGQALVALLVGCATPGDGDDVVGPYTGPVHRFVVDRVSLPMSSAEAREFGDDLSGDGTIDNQLGMVASSLAREGVLTEHDRDMIASGAIASTIELRADDLLNDATVSVLYRGSESAAAIEVGGQLVDGDFASNRTRTTKVPGSAVAMLPAFVDADPIALRLTAMEIDLVADGNGGYMGYLRGGVDTDEVFDVAYPALVQMFTANPSAHIWFMRLLDRNQDWVAAQDEFRTTSLLVGLLAPDVSLFGRFALSFGFRVHISPCGDGPCVFSAQHNRCYNRAFDGSETDLDCGGTCQKCPAFAACAVASDCQTGACDQGTCRTASCSDGMRDGFETDVDCGGQCEPCATGKRCSSYVDCVSGDCIYNSPASPTFRCL